MFRKFKKTDCFEQLVEIHNAVTNNKQVINCYACSGTGTNSTFNPFEKKREESKCITCDGNKMLIEE